MKKVMYVATSPAHKRAFQAFPMSFEMKQRMVLPGKPEPGDADNFGIDTLRYHINRDELQQQINEFKPDVYVQASLPCAEGVKLPDGCKKVYVSHGLVGNHVKGLIKPAAFRTEVWKGCDLYCGAWDDVFTDWITHVAKVGEDKILLNALPQLDILYNGVEHRRKERLSSDFPMAYKENSEEKVVAFFGFCCKDRIDFVKHNEDYFRTAVELSRIAHSERFLLYVKPRQEKKKLMNYFHQHDLPELKESYRKTYEKTRVHYIGPKQNHVLDYYFADIFVVNGCSTVEIEACAMGKPLFVVRTKQNSQHGYDPYDTVKSGAAIEITDIKELDQKLRDCLRYRRYHEPEKQKALLDKIGITFDGQAHKRIQDRIAQL